MGFTYFILFIMGFAFCLFIMGFTGRRVNSRPKALSSGQEKEILRRVGLGETHDSLAVHFGAARSLISTMVKKYRGSTDFQINVAPKLTPNAPSVEQERAFPNMELNSEYCGLPCSAPWMSALDVATTLGTARGAGQSGVRDL